MKEKGITLIELLVVMTIMAIIALSAFPSYQSQLRESRRQDAIIGIRNMQLEIDAYILKNTTLPTSSDFPAKDSAENFYTVSYIKQNDSIYKIQAVAKTDRTQVDDVATNDSGDTISCSTIYITSQLDTTYPYECK